MVSAISSGKMDFRVFPSHKHTIALLFGIIHVFATGHLLCPQGRISYEKVPGHRLDGYVETVVSRMGRASELIKECSEICALGGPALAQVNSSIPCGFFNFKREISQRHFSSSFDKPSVRLNSHCHLPVDIDLNKEITLKKEPGYDTYNQICIQGTRDLISTHCPNVVNIFNRIPQHKMVSSSSVSFQASSREECAEICLMTTTFRCLSASFNTRSLTCHINNVTKTSHGSSYGFEEESDYIENNCLLVESGNNHYYQKYPGAYRSEYEYFNEKIKIPEVESAAKKKLKGQLEQQKSQKCINHSFRQIRSRTQIQPQFILRVIFVNSLEECKHECAQEKHFKCLSFNFVVAFSPKVNKNCELSDLDTRSLDIHDPAYFDFSGTRDIYAKEKQLNCIDVSQTCSPNGMEFILRTPFNFKGRIFTHKHFNRPKCFLRGQGKHMHLLQIPGNTEFPECGTEKFGDTLTNIVVVQFSEHVQTSDDMMYNLTCTVVAPGNAVVTSSYIGSGSGQPTPIEYLPAEHTLDSRVRLVIQYQGRPTTTIAVGDPLEFKLETQDGIDLLRDIFATDVVAKDPYSARTVRLIDNRGCPVDPYVFPSLGLSRSGDGLSTSFNAFKIPESNFLVFEASVHTCKNGCPAVFCDGPQGRQNSYGRRKKRSFPAFERHLNTTSEEEDFNVKEMLQVYESRAEINNFETKRAPDASIQTKQSKDTNQSECVSAEWYYTCVTLLLFCVITLLCMAVWVFCLHQKVRNLKMEPLTELPSQGKESYQTRQLDFVEISSGELSRDGGKLFTKPNLPYFKEGNYHRSNILKYQEFQDPSEPICTNPSLFDERTCRKESPRS